MRCPLQKSKRLRGYSRGDTYKDSRKRRKKVGNTREGYIEHLKREHRRSGEPHRAHRKRVREWEEARRREPTD